MKHAILGVGAIGGLMAVALSSVGEDVTLVVRPNKVADFPKQLTLEQPNGTVTADAHAVVSQLDAEVDILWIVTKIYQLQGAFENIKTTPRMIVPLLNGVDHMAVLRAHFLPQIVVPGAISVEADRLSKNRFAQRNAVRLTVGTGAQAVLGSIFERIHDKLGFDCRFVSNEKTLLWTKLCFLASFALATAASGKNKGEIVTDPEWRALMFGAANEATAVANADGAEIDGAKIHVILENAHASMRSSLAKDLVAGRELELDGIGGPIVRGGVTYGIPTPATNKLTETIREKMAKK